MKTTKSLCIRKSLPLWYIIILITVSVACLVLGIVIGYKWYSQHVLLQDSTIRYGAAKQNITIHSICWKNYPSWRELTFSIDGDISFITRENGTIVFNDLTNSDTFEETFREHKVSKNGNDIIYYDIVTYNICGGIVCANLPKTDDQNPIIATIENSYYLTFSEKETNYIVGCISMLDTEYTQWTESEVQYSNMNLNIYLSAFMLSKTYDQVYPLHQKVPKQAISIQKEDGSYLNCTIYNNSDNSWSFETRLPHVELWYKGVWIELNSPYADNLSIVSIAPHESKNITPSNEVNDTYPTLMSGIYRLVIYGENDEFIVSDTFLME